nr:hypothetical protein [Bacteroidota bacterium]
MKKSILNIIGIATISAMALTSCKTSADKVDAAQENVTEAEQDLNKANEELTLEVAKFQAESDSQIIANENAIAEINASIANEKQKVKEKLKKRNAELEAKNKEMKNKLSGYKADSKDNLEAFRVELKHDMNELGQALKDFTKNNK